jgi:hypothetical protein
MQQNLGLFERVVRLLLGLLIVTVIVSRDSYGWVEVSVLVCALLLILNGILARCYLWKWLGLNTHRNSFEFCRQSRGRTNDSH